MEPGQVPVVPVAVYSDYTCPWCYVGAIRLYRAIQQLAGRVAVQVTWKPFEIHPEVPPEGIPYADLGYPPHVLAGMFKELRRVSAEEGLDFEKRIGIGRLANTHRALLAGAYAQLKQPDYFEAFHYGMFHAYFTDGVNLADPAVLCQIAASTGVDAALMETSLNNSSKYEGILDETSREARRHSITSTPTFFFDSRYFLAGAQPTAALQQAIEQTAAASGGAY